MRILGNKLYHNESLIIHATGSPASPLDIKIIPKNGSILINISWDDGASNGVMDFSTRHNLSMSVDKSIFDDHRRNIDGGMSQAVYSYGTQRMMYQSKDYSGTIHAIPDSISVGKFLGAVTLTFFNPTISKGKENEAIVNLTIK